MKILFITILSFSLQANLVLKNPLDLEREELDVYEKLEIPSHQLDALFEAEGKKKVKREFAHPRINKSQEKTDKESCSSFDLRKLYPAVKDQGELSNCWSYASADLLRGPLAKKYSYLRFFGLSSLDMVCSRSYNRGASAEEVMKNLKEIQKRGVCLDRDMLEVKSRLTERQLRDLFRENKKFVKKYDEKALQKRGHRKKRVDGCSFVMELNQQRMQVVDELLPLLEKENEGNKVKVIDKQELKKSEHLDELLTTLMEGSNSVEEFIKKVNSVGDCEKKRIGGENSNIAPGFFSSLGEPSHEEIHPDSEEGREKFIKEMQFASKQKQPISLFIFSGDFMNFQETGKKQSKQQGGHMVLGIARKFDEKNKRCLVYVRNSWGEEGSKDFSGWYDEEDLFDYVYGTLQFNLSSG